jgi:5'-nucleotidase
MQIVITNDDGMDAPGLAALRGACQEFGEVIAIAPDCEKSGVGHQITTMATIPVSDEPGKGYRVCGTPADCVRLAVSCLAPDARLVVSGINRGGNLGADVYVSGTVAAAREATLLGVPAISVSHFVMRGRQLDWMRAEGMARRVLRMLLEHPMPEAVFWNVNLPHLLPEDPEPAIIECPLDFSPLQVQFRREAEGFRYAGDYHKRPRRPGTDVDFCFQGYITITAIPLALGGRRAEP